MEQLPPATTAAKRGESHEDGGRVQPLDIEGVWATINAWPAALDRRLTGVEAVTGHAPPGTRLPVDSCASAHAPATLQSGRRSRLLSQSTRVVRREEWRTLNSTGDSSALW